MKFESSHLSLEEMNQRLFSSTDQLETPDGAGQGLRGSAREGFAPPRMQGCFAAPQHLLRRRPFVRPLCFGKRALPHGEALVLSVLHNGGQRQLKITKLKF